MGTEAYNWERAEIGRTYDVVGFLNYLPKRYFLGGREWGDRKTYHLKLYNTVHQMIDVFVETKSMHSEVFLNIATNFQGALIYIEDCEEKFYTVVPTKLVKLRELPSFPT